MTGMVAADVPPVRGLLSDAAVIKHLGHGMQAGGERRPVATLRKLSRGLPETEPRWATAPVRDLLDEAMKRFDGRPVDAGAWLAPRLHATLPMTRSEAADSRLWNFLAMVVAPDYVAFRHRRKEGAQASRFCGPHYPKAFARIWWAAELSRDGGTTGRRYLRVGSRTF